MTPLAKMQTGKPSGAARPAPGQPPVPRPDRRFYAKVKAFGRFGIRWFQPQLMQMEHWHGHIEFNWLTKGSMDYVFDGGPISVGANRLIAFWAGIPHQTVGLHDTEEARQINIYLPMDAFLEMPQLGRLTETLMGGGVIQFTPECGGLDMLERWHADYRSGNAVRTDLVRAEIGTMFRRAAVTGWETLLPAWLERTGTRTRTATPVRYVVRMLRHIVENITDPLAAEDIARGALAMGTGAVLERCAEGSSFPQHLMELTNRAMVLGVGASADSVAAKPRVRSNRKTAR